MRSIPSWQIPFLGLKQFPRGLTLFEIETFFSFDNKERQAICTRRGDHLRQAFAIHLGFLKLTGTTLHTVDRIPIFVLASIAVELDLPQIDIATLRSLYSKRKRTLYEHQQWAMDFLGIQPFTEHRQRSVMRAFSPPITQSIDPDSLLIDINCWLFTRSICLPGQRRVRAMAFKAARRAEQQMAQAAMTEIPDWIRQCWIEELFTARGDINTHLEWLALPPHNRSPGALDEATERLVYLRHLLVPRCSLGAVGLKNILALSQRCQARKSSRLQRLREPKRSLEIACFLRHCMLVTTDTILSLCDMRLSDLRRQAREQALKAEHSELHGTKTLLHQLRQYAEDADHSDAEVRQYVLNQLPIDSRLLVPRAHYYRQALAADRNRVNRLLNAMTTPQLVCAEGSSIDTLFSLWLQRKNTRKVPLTEKEIDAVPRRWRVHLTDSDSKLSIAAFNCAVMTELRCALRNGSAWAPDSLSYVKNESMLINEKDWKIQRISAYRDFNLPTDARTYLQQRVDQLTSGLSGVSEATKQHRITIDGRGVHMEALRAIDEDRPFFTARGKYLRDIGPVQLPEIIVDIDAEIRFSWILLQRAPRNKQELLAIYGAVLVQGTARTVSEMSLMMPGVSSAAISDALKLLEKGNVLRAANDAVVSYMFRHQITTFWGAGKVVSSDGISLDATRALWNARVDPKRRTYGMGQYQHVLDRWGIIYNQPIILGTRQAGAAIEGAVRQSAVDTLERIAVDTHGYTDFAMGLARLLGFDLCPRLKSLKDRLLYIPAGLSYPENITSIVRPVLDLSLPEKQLDALVRLAASIKAGKVTATAVLKRYSSVARGDPVYKAGKTLGQLERSIFLCDILTSNDFRRSLHRDLSHGEAVHSLQRKIYQAGIRANRGRRFDELVAISGSLTLLTNIVMAWNTAKLQSTYEQALRGESDISLEHILQIAPIHNRHINFNGRFHFPIEQGVDRLFGSVDGIMAV